MTIQEKITKLKKEKNAIILAHIYQDGAVQAIADFVGDSLELSRKALDVECDVIVFCGVRFMAESAKILNPNKTVLLPVLTAGCPMADMVDAQAIIDHRSEHPDAAVVCYVNSSAEAKAESDVCCTSSNAVKVVRSLEQDKIIFVPDENLGSYVAAQVPEKEIILHKGYCIVHKRVLVDEVQKAKEALPDAQLLVHPECTPDVVDQAHFVGSTAQIINYAKESTHDQFIIATEMGILHILQNQNPDKKFYMASPKLVCVNMKKTHIEDVLASLENMEHEIILKEELMNRARISLDRMLAVK
ncbi:MAG: quinolinate synthase NadA [Clostridiales bacterium]|nr:quinolinate synthase NadA [Clostridiales bacterium]